MKDFSYSLLPEEGLAILTAPEIDGRGPMFLADFHDNRVFIFKPTGHFIGYSPTRGVLLARGPLEMKDGMWVAWADEDAIKKFPDVDLTSETLDYCSV